MYGKDVFLRGLNKFLAKQFEKLWMSSSLDGIIWEKLEKLVL